MLGFCQKFHYHNRQYLLRIVDSDLQHTKIDEQVAEMYNRCFQGEIWGGIVSQLLEFSNGVGPTSIGFTLVVIECVSEKPVFLASWIWNGQTRAIEMFNTCKDLSDKHFSAFHILDQVNRYIVPLMAVKYGGTSPETVQYRLAVLQKNPYLISALHTYSRLGFRVEK